MDDKNFNSSDNANSSSEDKINDIISSVSNKDVADEPEQVSESDEKGGFQLNIDYESIESEYAEIPDADPIKPVKKPSKKKVQGVNNSVFGGILLIIIILAVSALIAITGIVIGRDVLGFGDPTNKITIEIPEGATVTEIAEILTEEGIISYPDVFRFIVKLKSAGGSMFPGDIELSSNMSYEAIILQLCKVREERATVRITFEEGITLYEASTRLEENGVCDADDFIYTFNNTIYGYDFEDMVETSKLKFYKMEGYLYPDTYDFYLGDEPYNVAKKFKARFAEKVNYNMLDRAEKLGYTLDEVITLASIIQMESGEAEEMKNVASVFINRLNNPTEFPKLQSDTTDNYVDKVIKPNSTIDYKEMNEAYDTYISNGLPPGPICNPGIDAITAVLYPNETNYYFFCSNLETREFFYARTNAEHEENLVLAGLK